MVALCGFERHSVAFAVFFDHSRDAAFEVVDFARCVDVIGFGQAVVITTPGFDFFGGGLRRDLRPEGCPVNVAGKKQVAFAAVPAVFDT